MGEVCVWGGGLRLSCCGEVFSMYLLVMGEVCVCLCVSRGGGL